MFTTSESGYGIVDTLRGAKSYSWARQSGRDPAVVIPMAANGCVGA